MKKARGRPTNWQRIQTYIGAYTRNSEKIVARGKLIAWPSFRSLAVVETPWDPGDRVKITVERLKASGRRNPKKGALSPK